MGSTNFSVLFRDKDRFPDSDCFFSQEKLKEELFKENNRLIDEKGSEWKNIKLKIYKITDLPGRFTTSEVTSELVYTYCLR